MSRDIKLSNIKGLLIFLVVFAHMLSPYQEYYNGLYLFIYSFHMPLFILLSGYFAKHCSIKKAVNFIWLYLVFQFLYQSFLIYVIPNHEFEMVVYKPYYHLWYLVSMAFWYMIAVFIRKSSLKNMNKSVLVLLCFAVGIGSKYINEYAERVMKHFNSNFDSYSFSYQRTLSFLPFFILGLFLTEENMYRWYHIFEKHRIIIITTICGVFAYFTMSDDTNTEKILKGCFGVAKMKGSLTVVSVQIFLGYFISLVMCYLILNLISSKTCILTKWGDRTLPIFLFHRFITRIFKKYTFLLGDLNHTILLALLFVSVVIIVCIFSSDFFVDLTYFLWHPYKFAKNIVKKLRPAT